jgi:hypothetical protein
MTSGGQPPDRREGRRLPNRVIGNYEEGRSMETTLFDQPWIPLCLLYAGVWFVVFFCAGPRNFPPTQDDSSAGPVTGENARAEASE